MEFTEAWDDSCSMVGLAARAGDFQELQNLIQKSSCVDVADNRGWRPLHEAAVHPENLECLEELLKHDDTNVDWTTHEGETALLLACKRRRGSTADKAVRLLLQYGASPNLSDNEEETPLLVAAKNRNLLIVKQLLTSKADPDAGDCSGWRPLHQAAMSGHVEILKSLLEAQARIDVQDECGMTPLFTAAQHGQAECLKELLKAAEERGQRDIVNVGAEDWATPLMIAAQQGYRSCLAILLDHGANPNLRTTDNITALHLAVQGDHAECLSLLAEHMDLQPLIQACHPARTDLYPNLALVREFVSPIHLALEWGSHECLKLLLGYGFSPDSVHQRTNLPTDFFLPSDLGRYESAVSFAVYKEDKNGLSILLKAGASCNAPSIHSLHPVIRALALPCPDMLNILLENGAELNCCQRMMRTNEILLASFVSQYHMEELLLHGCDPELCFGNETSILLFASALVLNSSEVNLIRKLRFILQFVVMTSTVQKACYRVIEKVREYSEYSEHLWFSILTQINQPSSLKHMSRMKIRRHMYSIYGPQFVKHLGLLSLPTPITDYLSFSSLP